MQSGKKKSPRRGSEYQREYRQRMASQGFVKIEVWVPKPCRQELYDHASRLREMWNDPFVDKETSMWTNTMLLETLNDTDAAKSGDWQVELVEGTEESLVVTLKGYGDLEVYVSVCGEQILASVLLWPVGAVEDTAGFNMALLSDHKLLPLSTFGIAKGPGGDWYELFGALSARSTAESVLTEIVTLADNALEIAEAYSEWLC